FLSSCISFSLSFSFSLSLPVALAAPILLARRGSGRGHRCGATAAGRMSSEVWEAGMATGAESSLRHCTTEGSRARGGRKERWGMEIGESRDGIGTKAGPDVESANMGFLEQ